MAPIFGTIMAGGFDITAHVLYDSLHVTLAINDQPDTASFDVMLMDNYVDSALSVGHEVLISLGEDALFGGQILTTQTVCGPARGPHKRSVLCADYLQVLDSERLVTYEWPAQSATATILDLMARFANKPGGVLVDTGGVEAGLPSHAAFAVVNERISTVLRRLVTMFPAGGGFYVHPLKILRVWSGVFEPGLTPPAILTLENPSLKAFSETVDNSHFRDTVIVEGLRTTAPIGYEWDPATDPAFLYSVPVEDASILDKISYLETPPREVRIGSQRLLVRRAEGPWSVAAGTANTTRVTADIGWPPSAGINHVTVESSVFVQGRAMPWVKINEQYLKVIAYSGAGVTPAFLQVPGTGWGALVSDIKTGATVTAIDSIGDLQTTGRYDVAGSLERIRPQPIGAEVVMTVYAQYYSSAVHSHLVQDGRYSRTGATGRANQEITDFKQAIITIQFESDDLNAKPGRLQAYNIPDPVVTLLQGDYMILSVDFSWPVWGEPPRRVCTAAEVHAASVVDAWLVDRR